VHVLAHLFYCYCWLGHWPALVLVGWLVVWLVGWLVGSLPPYLPTSPPTHPRSVRQSHTGCTLYANDRDMEECPLVSRVTDQVLVGASSSTVFFLKKNKHNFRLQSFCSALRLKHPRRNATQRNATQRDGLPSISHSQNDGKLSAVQVQSGGGQGHQCAVGELQGPPPPPPAQGALGAGSGGGGSGAVAAIFACRDYRVKLDGVRLPVTMKGSRLALFQGGGWVSG
jgi:hypothetical protein